MMVLEYIITFREFLASLDFYIIKGDRRLHYLSGGLSP